MSPEASLIASLVDSFQIGEPIKGLFRSKFSTAQEQDRMVGLRLAIRVQDAYSKKGEIDVVLVRFVEREMFERADVIARFMRMMLQELIAHEQVEGQAADAQGFDGQRWAGAEPCMECIRGLQRLQWCP